MTDSHNGSAPLVNLDRILERLREQGMRITGGRRAIIQVLLADRRPHSLEELQAAAAKRESKVDYTTVFRLMTVLEKLGIVQKLSLHQSCSQFELIDPGLHHDHIVCRTCGSITLIENECPVEAVESRISREYGFRELTHSLEFHGICPRCQE